MSYDLNQKKIAVLATDGYEQSELEQPVQELKEQGAAITIVSLEAGQIKGWKDGDWGDAIDVDMTVDDADADDFNALLLPGGVLNPDKLRINQKATDFIKAFFVQHKPVAAICHGPWTLINAGVVQGRKLTSWPSIRADLQNAGAEWVDEECVCDQALVTSRNPDDLPAFIAKFSEEVAEGKHALQIA